MAVRALADPGVPPADADLPALVRERFDGRAFAPAELERRGVRLVGGRAYYTALGRSWLLELAPSPAAGPRPSGPA